MLWRVIILAALMLGAAIFVWLLWPSHRQFDLPAGFDTRSPRALEHGAYITAAAGCVNCHWNRKARGAKFAGGREFKTPFGVFHSPNITPDKETGIGSWSDQDFLNAVLAGAGVHGEQLYPVFPYTSYSGMTVEDALSIKAYLFSLAPVRSENKPHQLQFPFGWRALMKGWKFLFFGPDLKITMPTEPVAVGRGRYIVQALGHCGECHTPRNALGAMDGSAFLKGNSNGPDGWAVPALVGPSKSNFAQWSVEEIEEYLKSGVKPDFDSAQGPMAEVIEDNTKWLTVEDRHAVALYLKSLNP